MKAKNYMRLEQKLDLLIAEVQKLQGKARPSDGWLSNTEVTEMLQVSPRTLQNYRDEGVIPFTKVGKKLYYRSADIQQHLERHYHRGFNNVRRVMS